MARKKSDNRSRHPRFDYPILRKAGYHEGAVNYRRAASKSEYRRLIYQGWAEVTHDRTYKDISAAPSDGELCGDSSTGTCSDGVELQDDEGVGTKEHS